MMKIAEPTVAVPVKSGESAAPGYNVTEVKRQRDKLKKATQDFEAIFVGMMLKEMRKTMTSDNPLFGKSSESKYYQEMMDDAVAHQISRTGQFGLGSLLYKKVEHTLPPDPDAIVRQTLKILT
jgi:peptidoglycan hydrolase FlgJ